VARPRLSSAPGYHVRALQRGLAVLATLAASDEPLTLSDVSLRLGLPKPTALRLLECLRAEGFAAYDARAARYSVGVRAFEVGSAYLTHSPLEQTALPFLHRLADETQQTANLGVLDRGEVVHLAVVQPERPLRFHTRAGARAPFYCTALGKVLAAALDDTAVRELLAHARPDRRTPTTIIDVEALAGEIARIRNRGYAEDLEEFSPGLRCLAMPVHAAEGQVVAALSISGQASEFTDVHHPRLLSALRAAASDLSKRLGWFDPGEHAWPTAGAVMRGSADGAIFQERRSR
jgi:DNA-binding IclR family transcriptional regulator